MTVDWVHESNGGGGGEGCCGWELLVDGWLSIVGGVPRRADNQ